MTGSEMFERIEYLKGEFSRSIEVETGKAIYAALRYYIGKIYEEKPLEDYSEIYQRIFRETCNIIGGYVRAMGEVRSE